LKAAQREGAKPPRTLKIGVRIVSPISALL
jgi:hypothetical protein